MNWAVVISTVVVVIGAVIGIIKSQKIKNVAIITQALLSSISQSLSDTDDTPGKLTPAEIAEAIEAAGKAAKGVLKDV